MVPAKRVLYEQMSNSCVEAVESAVAILRRMREEQTLSSLMLFDSHFIGEIMGILIMALQKRRGSELQAKLQFCFETFRSMEKIGWCEQLSPELESTVQASGMLDPRVLQPTQPSRPLNPLDPRITGAVDITADDGALTSLADYYEM
jgi:hypothetical protein